jgi:hypothetical protein
MTLIEKFLPRMYCFMGSGILSNTYDESVAEGNATECEKIADEFAIGFADWVGQNTINYSSGKFRMKTLKPTLFTSKELLEIYKKEKGL